MTWVDEVDRGLLTSCVDWQVERLGKLFSHAQIFSTGQSTVRVKLWSVWPMTTVIANVLRKRERPCVSCIE